MGKNTCVGYTKKNNKAQNFEFFMLDLVFFTRDTCHYANEKPISTVLKNIIAHVAHLVIVICIYCM